MMVFYAVILPLWRRKYEPEEDRPAERVLPEDSDLFSGRSHNRTEDIERLARNGRWSTALNCVRALASTGEESSPLTIEETKSRVAAKCPQSPQSLPGLGEMPKMERGEKVDWNGLALRLGEGGRARAAHLSQVYGEESVTLAVEDITGALESAKRKSSPGVDGLNIVKVDIKNAYNSIRLDAVYQALRKHHPSLIRWFLLSHVGGSAQFFGRGVEFCTTMRIRQGDPLASFFLR